MTNNIIDLVTCGDWASFVEQSENLLYINNLKPYIRTKNRLIYGGTKTNFSSLLNGISDCVVITTHSTEKRRMKQIESYGFQVVAAGRDAHDTLFYIKAVA